MSGIHFGLGKATGALVGGFVFERYGARTTFEAAAAGTGLAFVLLVITSVFLQSRWVGL